MERFSCCGTCKCGFDAEIVYAGNTEPEDLSALNIKGKVLAVNASDKNIDKDMTLFVRRYPGLYETIL
jgi:hypothetical protein